MKGEAFIRRTRRYARKNGLEFLQDVRRGKGSHQTIYLGSRFTVVPHGEIGSGLLAAMLKELGINRKDW